MRARSGALQILGLVWVACAAVLWAFVGTGWATVWNESTVGGIQNAVNNAAPYDTITIAPGTYHMTSRLNIYAHHLTIEGSTGNRDDVVDEPSRWEMTVALTDQAPKGECTSHVTPRRLQRFKHPPGRKLAWTNTSLAGGKVVQTGKATADRWGLVTLADVRITKGKNRLRLVPVSE